MGKDYIHGTQLATATLKDLPFHAAFASKIQDFEQNEHGFFPGHRMGDLQGDDSGSVYTKIGGISRGRVFFLSVMVLLLVKGLEFSQAQAALRAEVDASRTELGACQEPCDPTACLAGEAFGPQAAAECCTHGGRRFGCADAEGEGEETGGPEWKRALADPRGNRRHSSGHGGPRHPGVTAAGRAA
ncbi:hypothetical protein NDU88_004854 [Pleurodeles waltl]|uniref:Uncharacterized protein n=1 Tax=Pleurodeles waltl TaxID=8319 RepID=A0AAV7RGT6_PLEWA|nr:hypothetical protein NDU88_004854 [Pleurodeles waltl]